MPGPRPFGTAMRFSVPGVAAGWLDRNSHCPPDAVCGCPTLSISTLPWVLVSVTPCVMAWLEGACAVSTTGCGGFTTSSALLLTNSVTAIVVVPSEAPVAAFVTAILIWPVLAPTGTPAGFTETVNESGVVPLACPPSVIQQVDAVAA